MKLDLHAHTAGISQCCRIPAVQVLYHAKAIGLDGIVLTNHYQRVYVKDGDALGFARRYIEEFRLTRALGEEMGVKVFFGVELTPTATPALHYLLYGVPTDFLLAHPELYEYSLEKLYGLVKAAGGALIQAHPFRSGMTVQDTRYLDGVEISSHPLYHKSYARQLLDIGHEHGLIVTSAGDYHGDAYRPICATCVPDTVEDEKALADFLLETEEVRLIVHEPLTAQPYWVTYRRDGRETEGDKPYF